MRRFILTLEFLCCILVPLFGNGTVEVITIDVSGNKRTKATTLLRELNFKLGDQFLESELEQLTDQNEKRLINSGLFNKVNISYTVDTIKKQAHQPTGIRVNIEVTERYYFYAAPQLKISGMNFNTWWKQYNLNLQYIDFGLRATQNNFSGRNDQLKLVLNTGFTNKIKIEYKLPYIDKRKIYGIVPKVEYFNSRQTQVASYYHQRVFFPDTIPPQFTAPAQRHFSASMGVSRRKDVRMIQLLELRYEHNTVVDSLNQNEQLHPFFPNRKTRFQFFTLRGEVEFNFTDIQFYPLKGWYHKTKIEKFGLGVLDDINQFRINSTTTYYHSFSEKSSLLLNTKWQLSTPQQQPYYLTRAIGHGDDIVRAYDDYLIDGQHYLLLRSAFRYKTLTFSLKNPVRFIRKIPEVPFTVYLKPFAEYAKIWDSAAQSTAIYPLSNKWLRGLGLGMDITSIYDAVLSLEYSFNHLNEHGLAVYFQFKY